MPHQVVGLQARSGDQRDAFDVTAGTFEIHIRSRLNKQHGARLTFELGQRLAERLGLVRVERPGLDDGQFFLRQLRGQRRAQRAGNHFLRQRVTVFARRGAMHGTPVTPEW